MFIGLVLHAERAGEPAILLRDAPDDEASAWLLEPFLAGDDATILFGDGGSAKSYLGLALGLSLHTGHPLLGLPVQTPTRVLYLDFEWRPFPHKKRMRLLLGPGAALPDLVYRHCVGSLSGQVEAIRRVINDHNVGAVVLDSVALACNGAPEESSVAIEFFQSLRRLRVPTLCIAHVNRAGDTHKPFGSAFFHNSARVCWFIEPIQQEHDYLSLRLRNRKLNDGGPYRELGFRFDFGPDRVAICPRALADLTSAAATDLKERMVVALKTESQGAQLTYRELATLTDSKADSIRKTAQRHPDTFLVGTADGQACVALRRTLEVVGG
jgi:hypothetical protein